MKFVASVSFVCALALGAGVASSAAPGDSADLGRIASGIAGRPVTLTCQPPSVLHDLGGRAFAGSGRVEISSRSCAILKAFAKQPDRSPVKKEIDFFGAAMSVAHEAWHVRGIKDEATANCYALQTFWRVLVGLGATSAWAKRWAHANGPFYYAGYPYPYNSADCFDGGRLDLHRNHVGWP